MSGWQEPNGIGIVAGTNERLESKNVGRIGRTAEEGRKRDVKRSDGGDGRRAECAVEKRALEQGLPSCEQRRLRDDRTRFVWCGWRRDIHIVTAAAIRRDVETVCLKWRSARTQDERDEEQRRQLRERASHCN